MWKHYLLILLTLWAMNHASARSIDMRPRTAILLKSGSFIAQDSPWSATLYSPSGAALRQYKLNDLHLIEMSPDENLLLLAGRDGQLSVCDIQTGKTLWAKGSSRTRLGYIYDASFSGNGKTVVAGDDGQVTVFEASSGTQVGALREKGAMSVALSFDGTTGVLVTFGERIYTFDVASGTLQDTGLTGAWPVRFASDGRHFAMRSENSGRSEQLRVVSAADPTKKIDLGQFRQIGHIRPTADGKFNVTGFTEQPDLGRIQISGFQCDPNVGEMKLIWVGKELWGIREKADFDANKMLGVSTSYNLITRLIDLRHQTVACTIDNHANYRATPPRTIFLLVTIGLGFAGVVYALTRGARRRLGRRYHRLRA